MSFLDAFVFTEAINSVALSHDEGCDCLTCRAAGGDEDASARLRELIYEARAGKKG